MTTANIAKNLSRVALSCLALAAASAQAHGWGDQNPYLPVVAPAAPHHADQRGFDDRFGRGFPPRHDDYAGIDLRQRQQMERIRDGMASGRINRHEARELLREQGEIEHAQRRYLADGRLSRDEWISLNRMLDQSAADIRAEKHDRDRR